MALVAPATAGATVRLGPDLVPTPNSLGYGCAPGYPSCSWVNLHGTNAAVPTASPIDGVITKWGFRVGCCNPAQTEATTMTLKTFRPGTHDGEFGYTFIDPVNTGPSFVIPPGNQVLADPAGELPARLPIAAGQSIGIVADGPIEAELPKAKTAKPRISSAAPTVLARASYSVKPGKRKSVQLKFSAKALAFLAQKRTRKVVVTIQPKDGQTVSTTRTLKFPKPKPAKHH